MFSKRLIELLGLQIYVYGLDEYNLLPEGTPLSAMFFCHAFSKTQYNLEKACQKICELNNSRRPSDRYLIMISIDHPNVGTRKLYKEEPWPKSGSFKHQYIILKLYLHSKSTASAIARIIECFDCYVFGLKSKSSVGKWGVIGHSMGAISAEFSVTFEPKISTVIIISACLNMNTWLPFFAKNNGLEPEFYASKEIQNMIAVGSENVIHNIRHSNILVLNRDKDKLVPKSIVEETHMEIRKIHQGVEDHDWKFTMLPGTDHDLDNAYIAEVMKWTEKWMMSSTTDKNEKLMAKL